MKHGHTGNARHATGEHQEKAQGRQHVTSRHATPLHPVLGAHGQPGNDGPDGDEPGVVRAVKGERAGGGSRNTFVALHPVSFHWQLVGLKVERSISS